MLPAPPGPDLPNSAANPGDARNLHAAASAAMALHLHASGFEADVVQQVAAHCLAGRVPERVAGRIRSPKGLACKLFRWLRRKAIRTEARFKDALQRLQRSVSRPRPADPSIAAEIRESAESVRRDLEEIAEPERLILRELWRCGNWPESIDTAMGSGLSKSQHRSLRGSAMRAFARSIQSLTDLTDDERVAIVEIAVAAFVAHTTIDEVVA
jgi:hypothetical protein